MLTIPWINHCGLVFTTGLRGIKQAIDMALHKEVLYLLLLAYIDVEVNQFHQQPGFKPATPAHSTTILCAVALALAAASGALTTTSATSST